MSRIEEIKERIETLKYEIFYEEMKDLGYDYKYVNVRRDEIEKLEDELKTLTQ